MPLFLGEFGMAAEVENVGDYIAALYDRLDSCLASGAQWNYTPEWTEHAKDGWNGEDFNILDPRGMPRPNFRARPYPRLTAGIPLRFTYRQNLHAGQGPALEYVWSHCPDRGATELFLPATLLPPGSPLEVQPTGVLCQYDTTRQVLLCRAPSAWHHRPANPRRNGLGRHAFTTAARNSALTTLSEPTRPPLNVADSPSSARHRGALALMETGHADESRIRSVPI